MALQIGAEQRIPTRVDMLIGELEKFLLDEQLGAKIAYAQRCSQHPTNRVLDGDSVGPLKLVGITGRELVFLSNSGAGKFRAGDSGFIGRSSTDLDEIQQGCLVEFQSYDPQTHLVHVEVSNWNKRPIPPLGSFPLFLDEDLYDATGQLLKVLGKVGQSFESDPLIQALLVDREAWINTSASERLQSVGALRGLNQSQALAFAAQAAQPIALIQGPPGTGKTRVIAEIVNQTFQENRSVLIATLSHRAANNALEQVAKVVDPQVRVAKLGPIAKGSTQNIQNLHNFESRNSFSQWASRTTRPVIAGTASARLPGLDGAVAKFDMVIIDEASQLTMPQILAASLVGKQLILVGDQNQLPPVLTLKHESRYIDLNVSGFEWLQTKHGFIMLDETYRMNEQITSFVSRNFYKNKLRCSTNRGYSKSEQSSTNGSSHSFFWYADNKRDGSYSVDEEARKVSHVVHHYLQLGVNADEICVVAPLRRQGQRIREWLRKLNPRDFRSSEGVVVDTVERLQGQERQIVLLSMGVTASDVESNPEFLLSPNRLNVAVSRAKELFIVFAAPEVATSAQIRRSQGQTVAPFDHLLTVSLLDRQGSQH